MASLVQSWRSRRAQREPYEPPTFNIVALGTSGVGKTVLLSSLFHELNYPVPGRAYHLEADLAQRTALAGVYRTVSDPGRPWPEGTEKNETREFVFDCVATDDAGGRHSILRMSYLDFSGELLETDDDQDVGAQQDLVTRIERAHALLGMIDGRRVLQLLRGEDEGHAYFVNTLQPMLGLMLSSSCPIHLVLTKWDLVRDFGEPADAGDQDRLGHVVDALMRDAHVNALVHARGRRQIVRLIPVSAVGRGFAELDARGHVVKRPGGRIRPINVDVPFCAVLPDLFAQIQVALDEAGRDDLDADARRRLREDSGALLASVGLVMNGPARRMLGIALGSALGVVGAGVSQLFMEWASTPLERKGRRVLEAQNARELRAAELQRLRQTVMDDFSRSVMRLEAAYPNSQLNRAWSLA